MTKALWCVAVLAVGCQEPANVFHTSVTGQSEVKGNPYPISLGGVLPPAAGFSNLDFNNNQDFKNQGVTKDQVDSVRVESIKLKILSPNSQDFSFLDDIHFTATAEGQESLIAEKSGVKDLGLKAPNPVLTLDLRTPEIKPFVTAPSMSISVSGNGRFPPQDTVIEATMDLRVEVHVL